MSDNSMYHSILREEIKSQCGICEAHNGLHYRWCEEVGIVPKGR